MALGALMQQPAQGRRAVRQPPAEIISDRFFTEPGQCQCPAPAMQAQLVGNGGQGVVVYDDIHRPVGADH